MAATMGHNRIAEAADTSETVKFVYCLRRLPHLSVEEFQRHWFDNHGPLVRSKKEVLRIRRYVQVHTVDHPVNESLREGREGPERYDGVAELWWDSMEDLEAVLASPEGQEAAAVLLADEETFIDLSNSPLWVANERPVIDD